VVHIAWPDAVAYAKWARKRLPTEADWEFAARGGRDRQDYLWGNDLKPGGKWMANTFQRHFPDKNTSEDGYVGAAPVASFEPNNFGLYEMSGNVWQWVSDWYRPDYYAQLRQGGALAINPHGPNDSFDPLEPGVAKRVQKGGSFLCTAQYCERYMPGARGKGDSETATNNVGFRCVRSQWEAINRRVQNCSREDPSAASLRDLPLGDVMLNPDGLAGTSAEESTHNSIFDRLKRRETPATSGTRIPVLCSAMGTTRWT